MRVESKRIFYNDNKLSQKILFDGGHVWQCIVFPYNLKNASRVCSVTQISKQESTQFIHHSLKKAKDCVTLCSREMAFISMKRIFGKGARDNILLQLTNCCFNVTYQYQCHNARYGLIYPEEVRISIQKKLGAQSPLQSNYRKPNEN